MKSTNTSSNENEVKARESQTYKNVIRAIVAGGMVSEKNINPSLINFMPEKEKGTYYVCYDYMSCNTHIPMSEIDPLERELCKSAFGGWAIWSTYEANI